MLGPGSGACRRLRRRPLTGEGIAVGLASARALVEEVRADAPASYERGWLSASRRYRLITESLLWVRRRRLTARAIVPSPERFPTVFSAVGNQLAR